MILFSKYSTETPKDAFHETILKRMLQFHKNDPQKPAFIQSETGGKISFKDLHEHCFAFAGWLAANGFKKGDIILLCLHNSWQFVVGCLGSWIAGLTVSPSSPQFGQFELSYQLKDSGAALILTDQACLPVVSAVCKSNETIVCVSDSEIKGTVFFKSCLKSRPLTKCVEIDRDNDLILLPYSSGTTGNPKGVMITFTNYAYMLSSYVAKYRAEYVARGFDDIVPTPIVVTFLPLYHAMGLFGMFWNVWLGSTQIMMAKFNIERYLEHIQEYAIVTLALVPSIVIQLANSPLLDKYDLSSVFLIATGSAPLSQSVVEKLKKRLPDVLFAQGYGMTETSVASHIGSPDAPPGSIGVLMPGTQMKIVTEDGKMCGPNEEGEMWLRGPQIMKGYWKRPKETAETFDKEGFMRTGDIVYYDQNGFTFVCDRLKELIKVHGKQVPPAELESVILELPTVQDCCVVGVEDERFGEVPRAFVVSSERNERAIQDHVNAKVASYKRLRGGVVFVDALPRTPTGKLLRRQLREQAKSKL